LRAMDINTGTTKWELTETAGANGWGGTISTATGLVFFGEERRRVRGRRRHDGQAAVELPDGNQGWKASPMAYMFDGKEYMAVIDGGNVIAFALGE
jgi:alcohol dehydrogenase (cytochrome c)